MIRAEFLLQHLSRAGFGVVTGVPCSYLTDFINAAIADPDLRYVGTANEGDAVAVACGAELAGVRGAVFLQNSGLGNAVSPLTSLTSTFGIPLLLMVTWRGQPGGPTDEPQHATMGRITTSLLKTMEIPWEFLPGEESEVPEAVGRSVHWMQTHRSPYAWVIRKGTVGGAKVGAPPVPPRASLAVPALQKPRALAVEEVLGAIHDGLQPEDLLIATTGYTGRTLYALGDRPNHLYMVGSMGCASSLGLGIALAGAPGRVVVVDGDGALLMRMGALAAIGREQPENLTHLVLDNGIHESTGGQHTASAGVDFAAIAAACRYPSVCRVRDTGEIGALLAERDGPLTFCHVATRPRRDPSLPRPSITPAEVAERFREWLRRGSGE